MVNVLVLVDHVGGSPKKVSNQILTAARKLGAGDVHALLMGEGARAAAEKVGAYGATRAHVWESSEAAEYATEPQTAAVVAAVEAAGADVLLYPADPFLSDVVARAAVRLGAGVITDVTDLSLDGDRVVATKAIFGGDMVSRCQVRGDRLQILGIKANAFVAEESGGGPTEVVDLDVTLDDKARRAKVVDVVEQEAGGRPEMTEAAIVVAGGRGLGKPENFRLVEELAQVLGGEYGGSRPVAQAGWIPPERQIGQTGKTIRPKLYIAAGISGAIQHRVGVEGSDVIVAINNDPNAPIMEFATYAIVGDALQILPALTESLRERKARRSGAGAHAGREAPADA